MIVAPGTDSISIDDGSPNRELRRDDVVRTVDMTLTGWHETMRDSSPFTQP
jgi:hypothetical protein